MSGQTLTDRIAAAQYHVVGSSMAKSVCKATTHEVMAPKKKHLDYLIQCTNESNVNVPQLADTLFERAGNSSWVVAFKALVSTHHLMCQGNERFIQYLASRNTLFNLSNFLDKSGVQGYDMSTFVRRYSKYLNEKAYAYRQMAFDFIRVKRGNDGLMRSMSVEKVLKALSVLQSQVDALLDFEAHPKDLSNGVMSAAFSLLFKDMIRLFACYNDGIINLLEKFFDLKKVQSKEGLEIYKKFLTCMIRVSEFFKIAEQVGIDKGDIPDIAQAPGSLLESMEQHVALQESKKSKEGRQSGGSTSGKDSPDGAATSSPVQPVDGAASVEAFPPPPSAPQSTSASTDLLGLQSNFLTSAALPPPGASPAPPTSWSDPFAPSEGSATAPTALDLFAMKPSDSESPAVTTSTTPSRAPTPAPPLTVSSPPGPSSALTPTQMATPTKTAADIFADAFGSLPEQAHPVSPRPEPVADIHLLTSDVLSPPSRGTSPLPDAALSTSLLPEAFTAAVESPAIPPAASLPTSSADPFSAIGSSPPATTALSPQPASVEPQTSLVPQAVDLDLFGGASPTPVDQSSGLASLGDLLLPTLSSSTQPPPATPQMQIPASVSPAPVACPIPTIPVMPSPSPSPSAQPNKLLVKDLDSSLASLVGNLGIDSPAKKGQWGGERKLTGGANWQPRAAPPSAWAHGASPTPQMAPGSLGFPASVQPGFGISSPPVPGASPMGAQPPRAFVPPSTQPVAHTAFTPIAPARTGPPSVSQSPQKSKDPLADLNLKNFM
uniref:clathrin coat assembly protein AP180-like isoform X2 n=1 Tax=Myxine glutinosa TaxID=7769 RepID=UPI00358ED452